MPWPPPPLLLLLLLLLLQLLRGLATGMKVQDFSSAQQWRPFAKQALKQLRDLPPPTACLSLAAFAHALQ